MYQIILALWPPPRAGRRSDDLPDRAWRDSVRERWAAYALKAARERQFDVIISDIGMPEMNGYQLAREVRLLPGYETVPMVAVTGYSMFDDKERSTNAGFNAHMTKPIDPRALLDLIDQL